MLLNKEAMQTALNNKQIIIREGKPYCVKCDTMLLKTSGDFSTFVNCECFQEEITVESILKGWSKALPSKDFHVTGKDYKKEDGLFYCCKCDTPKQAKVKDPKDNTKFAVVGIPCECTKRETERKEREQKQKEIQKAKKECFSSKVGFESTFENDDLSNKEITDKLLNNYIKHFDTYRKKGTGILFYGGTGTGKTFFARAVLHRLIEQGKRAKEINLIEAFHCNSTGEQKKQFITDLTYKDIVLIDDLGTERSNDTMIEFVYWLVEKLHDNKVPVIYTTNLSLSYLADVKKDTNIWRIYSRVLGHSNRLEIKGNDRRTGKNSTENHKQWLEFSEQK